jgi:hypothetical protein
MEFTGYRGPYTDGFPTQRVAGDGTVWREAGRNELAQAPADLLVYFGKTGAEPRPVGEYAGYAVGGAPFLPSMAALMPVYVRADQADPILLERYAAAKREWDALTIEAGHDPENAELRAKRDRAGKWHNAWAESLGEPGHGDPLCCQRYGRVHLPEFAVSPCRWHQPAGVRS